MCLRGQQYDASENKGFDFWPSYRFVAGIFKNADFVCGNLETLLSPSNPLTKDRKTDDNGTPLCNGPEELLRALRKAGYDMLVTANNHCCDYGTVGIEETKKALDRYLFANAGISYPQPSPVSSTDDNDPTTTDNHPNEADNQPTTAENHPNTADNHPTTAENGQGRNPFCIFEVNGIRIAVLSYTHFVKFFGCQ